MFSPKGKREYDRQAEMIMVGVEAPRALVEGAGVACDCGVADFPERKSRLACRGHMLGGQVNMVLELDHFAAGAEASAVPGFDRCWMEVRDDHRGALVGDSAEFGVCAIDLA
jgi:hypothetical protein